MTRRALAPILALALALALCAAGPAAGAGASERAAVPPPRAEARAVADLLTQFANELGPIERSAGDTAAKAPPALSNAEAIEVARTSGSAREWLEDHPDHRVAAELTESTRVWKVSFVGRDSGGKEKVEVEVYIADERGEITEVRTGPQVAWLMARGYKGAFGRAINEPVIWGALCLAFILPLIRWRRFLSLRTLDLAMLLSFSVSWIWFNEGEIFTSVPLQYPPMLYLAGRLIYIGLSRRGPREPEPPGTSDGVAPTAPPAPARPMLISWCPTWLMVALLVATMALRYGLNAFNANVIDVGYAGVIGADRILDGQTPYGTMPTDCGHCDTYGPLNYLLYAPFEAVYGWTGTWDDLPAAHGAATLFDLIALAGMIALGVSISGWRLGVGLGLAWAAFPFTGYVLETNANDGLIAAMLIWGLVLMRRPLWRGLFLGLALAAKLGPAVLLPLWSRHPFPLAPPRRRGARLLAYCAGLVLSVALTGWVLFLDGLNGVRAFYDRTIGYQLGRESPFSIWGQFPGLRPVQIAVTVALLLGALAVWRWPRRLDLLGITALSGALVIGLELTLIHWFYLYIPWFLPFALLAFVPEWPEPTRPRATPRAPAVPAPAREPEPVAVAT